MLWGDGSPTREFLYVEDAADGLILAGERYDGAEPVNLGTGREISIRDLATLIAELTGFGGEINWDTSMPNGQPRRHLDVTRARELFGFEARTELRDGLARRSPGTATRSLPPLDAGRLRLSQLAGSARGPDRPRRGTGHVHCWGRITCPSLGSTCSCTIRRCTAPTSFAAAPCIGSPGCYAR